MRCKPITAALAAVFLFIPSVTFAQVEVVESSPTIRPIGQPRNTDNGEAESGADSSNMQTEMYYQLQTLQQEVSVLRGMLEEQAHELKQLKQQRLDDYMDLDRRISELGGSAGTSRGDTGGNNPITTSQPATLAAPDDDEMASYNSAMEKIRARDYDAAIEAFKQHIDDHGSGRYAPNSHHWLGQLYQLRGKPEQAIQAYRQVVDEHADHAKASDAKLKLGQLYYQQGDRDKARSLLQEVADSNASEARLARNFLQENFQ